MRSKTCLPALAATLALAIGAAQAQTAPMAQPGSGARNMPLTEDDRVPRRDRKFIVEAAESGLFEVQAGQLASMKAENPLVKSYGSMLVDHHTAANNELVQIANARKVELPAGPPRGMRRDLERLGKETGGKFDREFLEKAGIDAHRKTIERFEKARDEVKDPQLRAFIERTLPTLRSHLAQAEKLSGKRG